MQQSLHSGFGKDQRRKQQRSGLHALHVAVDELALLQGQEAHSHPTQQMLHARLVTASVVPVRDIASKITISAGQRSHDRQHLHSPSHQNRSGLARLAMERAAAQRSVAGSMGSLSHKCTHEHSQSRYSAPAADVSLWAAAADDAEQKARNGHTCQSYFSPDKHGWARLYTEAAKEAAEAAAAEFSPHKLIRLGLAPSHVSDAKALHMDIEELRADTRQRQSSFKHSHFRTWASF